MQKQLFEELLLHRLRQQDQDKGSNEQLLNEIFVFMPETYRITQLLELVQIEASSPEYQNDFVLDDVLRSIVISIWKICVPTVVLGRALNTSKYTQCTILTKIIFYPRKLIT